MTTTPPMTAPTPAVPATRIAEIEKLAHELIEQGNGWWTTTNLAFAIGPKLNNDFIAACDPQTILALCALARGASGDAARLEWYVSMMNGAEQDRKRHAVEDAWMAAHNGVGGIRTLESLRAAIDAARSSQGGTE